MSYMDVGTRPIYWLILIMYVFRNKLLLNCAFAVDILAWLYISLLYYILISSHNHQVRFRHNQGVVC